LPEEFQIPLGKKPVPDTVSAVVEAYGKVEAVVEVAVKYDPIILFPRISPATESFCPGEVVPIPTFPPDVAKYAEPVEEIAVVEAYGKVEAVVVVAVKYDPTTWPTTESFAYGLVVPIPTFPFCKTVNPEVPATESPPAKVEVAVLDVA
jgi:Na+-transporting methylmalonyl-CoA/oxaloacetate decarboxylase gamma subunit